MQHQANSVNTLFNFGSFLPSVRVSAGGLSCGSPLAGFCLPRVSRLSRGAGAGLVSFWGTPRRFSSHRRASGAKHTGKVLCIGPRVLFRRLQDIGREVRPKASRPALASALAPCNSTARHRGSKPVVQQAALAERCAQCTHNPSVKWTPNGLARLRGQWHFPLRRAKPSGSAYLKRWPAHLRHRELRSVSASVTKMRDRKSTRLNSSHPRLSRMPSSA